MNNTIEELKRYLLDSIQKTNQRIKEKKENLANKFNVPKYYVNGIITFHVSEEDTFECNLKNVLAIANNNSMEGLYHLYENMALEKKIKEKEKVIIDLEKEIVSLRDRKEPELELLEKLFEHNDADEWIRDISEIFDDLIDVRYNKNDTNLTSLVCIRRLQQFFMDMKEKGY